MREDQIIKTLIDSIKTQLAPKWLMKYWDSDVQIRDYTITYYQMTYERPEGNRRKKQINVSIDIWSKNLDEIAKATDIIVQSGLKSHINDDWTLICQAINQQPLLADDSKITRHHVEIEYIALKSLT